MQKLKRWFKRFLIGFTLLGVLFGFLSGYWGMSNNPFFTVVVPLWTLFIALTIIRIFKGTKGEEVEEVEESPENMDYEKGQKLAALAGLWTYKEKEKFKAFTSPYQIENENGELETVGVIFTLVRIPETLTHKVFVKKAQELTDELGASMMIDLKKEHGEKYAYMVAFLTRSPLAQGVEVGVNDRFYIDESTMTLAPMRNSLGRRELLSFKEVSGVVIGGLPGAGKSASLATILTPLAMSDKVELLIIDGKGSPDWDSFKGRKNVEVIKFEEDPLEDTNNLQFIEQKLRTVYADAVKRLDEMGSEGINNFWNAPITNKRPYKVVVIDECQMFFDQANLKSREDRDLGDKIESYVTNIIRRFRSAGMTAIVATQKPTVDSVPSQIRDNASMRICFRVSSTSAEIATLGDRNDNITAMKIPEKLKGMAVLASEDGSFQYTRFDYIEPNTIRKKLSKVKPKKTVVIGQ